uniref:Uncharacterized protein n=1 Tax=Strongyloides stercoralis TaxID=6248 RepID=A0A0K0ERV5_STRER
MLNNNSLNIGKIPLSEAPETVNNILDQLLKNNIKLDDYKINLSVTVGKHHNSISSHDTKLNHSEGLPTTTETVCKNSFEHEDIKKNCLICKKGSKASHFRKR